MPNARELRQLRAQRLESAAALVEAAEKENRGLTPEETAVYDGHVLEADSLMTRVERLEKLATVQSEIVTPGQLRGNGAPVYIKRPGDNEVRAWAHWMRTGDASGIREYRASNDTDMNIGTDADGGYAVPTGHYQGIIARRDEMMLTAKLGLRQITGKGTTVNVPVDNEDDGEFVSTNEAAAYDRDAPALDQKAMTLVKYTKKIELSNELLEDEDSKVMAFLDDFVGRGMAKTHNALLLTEVAANGTALKTFASATVIAVDELEPITYNDNLEAYLDDSKSVSWVMKRSVHGEIALLDDANTRRYADNQMGGPGASLLGFPVAYSAKSGATTASAKSVYFGNWNYVGFREGQGFTVIRDPYTLAHLGQIRFVYAFRADYAVLQSEAIGYGVHPSA